MLASYIPSFTKIKRTNGVRPFPDFENRISTPFVMDKMPDIEEKIPGGGNKAKIPVEIKKLRNIEKNS